MNITISPIKNNNTMFRATQKDETKVVEKNQLNPQRVKEKKTKIIVGCCATAMIVVDVLYFLMKRKFKHDSVDKLNQQRAKIASVPRIKNIFELIKESPESFGPNAEEFMREKMLGGRRRFF